MDTAFFRSQVILGGGRANADAVVGCTERATGRQRSQQCAAHNRHSLAGLFVLVLGGNTAPRVDWMELADRLPTLARAIWILLRCVTRDHLRGVGSHGQRGQHVRRGCLAPVLDGGLLGCAVDDSVGGHQHECHDPAIGRSAWKLLHRLAYVVVILGVVHYYMLVKSDVRQPLAFALVLTPALLGFRGRQALYRLAQRRSPRCCHTAINRSSQ